MEPLPRWDRRDKWIYVVIAIAVCGVIYTTFRMVDG